MRSLALTSVQQRRLEKLSKDAGRSPHTMLRFVLQDGFDYCEYLVRSVDEGLKSLGRDARTYSTREVLKHARSVAEKNGARFRKAA
jgi:hypothetical protein